MTDPVTREGRDAKAVGDAITSVGVDKLIGAMAKGIAAAQRELDQNSIEVAQMMSGRYTDPDTNESRSTLVDFHGDKLSLIELGLTPTFYQFVETTLEVKVSVSIHREASSKSSTSRTTTRKKRHGFLGLGGSTTQVTSVNAEHSSKYSFSAEGASSIRTRMVPVPPPAILEERIRELMKEHAADEGDDG